MAITWITGNSGAGKTTLALKLQSQGNSPDEFSTILLDGDSMRKIWPELGLSKEDRWLNNIRIARLAKILEDQGFDVIVSTICPYKDLRSEVQKITNCRFIYLEGGKSGSEYPYEK